MTQPVAPHLWELRLSDLLGVLTTELHETKQVGQWISRRLRSGYTFSLLLGDDGSRRARLASDDRPGNATAWGRFHEEVEIMAQHLTIASWKTVAPSLAPGEVYRGALVEFQEKLTT